MEGDRKKENERENGDQGHTPAGPLLPLSFSEWKRHKMNGNQ